jgi:hypothetical protein
MLAETPVLSISQDSTFEKHTNLREEEIEETEETEQIVAIVAAEGVEILTLNLYPFPAHSPLDVQNWPTNVSLRSRVPNP